MEHDVPPPADAKEVAPADIASGGVPIEVKIEVGQTWRTIDGRTFCICSSCYSMFYVQESGGFPKPWHRKFAAQWLAAQCAVLVSSSTPTSGRGPNDPIEVP